MIDQLVMIDCFPIVELTIIEPKTIDHDLLSVGAARHGTAVEFPPPASHPPLPVDSFFAPPLFYANTVEAVIPNTF